MKLDLPVLPADVSPELRLWIERVVELINGGYYQPRLLTSAPVLGDMQVGELVFGLNTGAASTHEVFYKVSTTVIARWTHDATIT